MYDRLFLLLNIFFAKVHVYMNENKQSSCHKVWTEPLNVFDNTHHLPGILTLEHGGEQRSPVSRAQNSRQQLEFLSSHQHKTKQKSWSYYFRLINMFIIFPFLFLPTATILD